VGYQTVVARTWPKSKTDLPRHGSDLVPGLIEGSSGLVDPEVHPSVLVAGNVREAEAAVEPSGRLIDGVDGNEPDRRVPKRSGS